MKKSEDLLGLFVVSMEDGKEMGRVSDLIINPTEGAIEYLIIDNGIKYLGVKILPFRHVEGIGEYAVTIQSSSCVADMADEPEINQLLERDVRVKGTKVLTQKGTLIGTVAEFMIDDDSEGKISGCEVSSGKQGEASRTILADQIITFGKDVLVVKELQGGYSPDNGQGTGQPTTPKVAAETSADAIAPVSNIPAKVKSELENGDAAPVQAKPSVASEQSTEGQPHNEKQPVEKQQPSEAARLFEQRQRQFMVGRKASKRIETENGEVIIEEGQIITEELLDKAKVAGKFSELSMNTKV